MPKIQKVDAASVGNSPNNSVDNVEMQLSSISGQQLAVSGKKYEDMSAEERAIYRAWQEESDPEFLRSIGRDVDTKPTSQLQPVPNTTVQQPLEKVISRPIQNSTMTVNNTVPNPSPRPQVPTKPQKTPIMVAAKDELSVPIAVVTEFITSIMGNSFGYISLETANSMIGMIPKEDALTAIETSKEDAKKFLNHKDDDVRKAAIKKFFDTSDEGVEIYDNVMKTPGFEINPWKE
ncbi:MAG: hypothetical protein NC548_27830 [Lachnospiraceae bacterium]|nr:hypothetical protein [Lachnospiraceae bacterium]